MDSLIIVSCGLVFAVLVYFLFRLYLQNSGLNQALILEQDMKNAIADREKERHDEYLFMLTNSVGVLEDLAHKLYDGDIIIDGVTNEFKQDLAAIVHVLKTTPVNYYSAKLGTYELPTSAGEFDGLELLKARAPGLRNYKCIEVLLVARIMLNNKIDVVKATDTFISSLNFKKAV
jgi:hypothetical protein